MYIQRAFSLFNMLREYSDHQKTARIASGEIKEVVKYHLTPKTKKTSAAANVHLPIFEKSLVLGILG